VEAGVCAFITDSSNLMASECCEGRFLETKIVPNLSVFPSNPGILHHFLFAMVFSGNFVTTYYLPEEDIGSFLVSLNSTE